MAQVIDHEGKLAISFGWQTNWEKPEENNLLIVSKRVKAEEYSFLLGYCVQFIGNTGAISSYGHTYIFQTDDKNEWERVVLTRPVKKPRRGKRQGCPYDWEWVRGRWLRKWL